MFNLFGKKNKELEIFSPGVGKIIDLKDVPDPVFAEKMMGDGFAIIPEEGVIKSPVDGTISLMPDSRHAFGITTPEGAEILVHIGIDTVALKGEGFETFKAMGDKVKAGEPIIEVNLTKVKDKGPSMATPIIITNMDAFEIINLNLDAKEEEAVIEYKKK